MKDTKIPRIYIQYNCVPHYRRRIFELLGACPDYQFTLITDSKTDTPFMELADTRQALGHVHIAPRQDIRQGKTTWYWQPDAVALVKQDKPDLVIAMGSPYSLTAWALLGLGKIMGIPVLLWGHGLLAPESGPKWWLRKLFYSLAKGQLLYGDYAKRLLTEKGFDPDKLFVIYNSLDYDAQVLAREAITEYDRKIFREKIGVMNNQGLVVFAGRLQAVKRLDLLIQAVTRLAQRGRAVHIALIGHGDERETLAKLARDLGMAAFVHFLGAVYDERELATVIGASDLCVIPSGAGLTVMHAMVYGTPVLIHDRLAEHFPEWEAVAAGKTGYFYRYGEVDDLADKMEQAIFVEDGKRIMGGECRKMIETKYNPYGQYAIFMDIAARMIP